jgi:hypothetical protein
MSSFDDTQPPIPTLADGGHLTGSPLLFLFFDSSTETVAREHGTLGAQTTTNTNEPDVIKANFLKPFGKRPRALTAWRLLARKKAPGPYFAAAL